MRVLLLVLLAASCGPEPGRSLLYAHPEARGPFYRAGSDGLVHAVRAGAENSAPFAAAKAPDAFRVFIVGGSIARIYRGPGALEEALPPLLPAGKRLELSNAGMSGYDAARERLIVSELKRWQPDLIVLLSGHNQSAALPPPLPGWRLRLGLWAVNAGLVKPRQPPIGRKAGLAQMAVFERDLRAMARDAKAAGARLLIVRPPLNLRDGPPKVTPARSPAFFGGWVKRLAGDCDGARRLWEKASGEEEAAPAAWLEARCLERAGRSAQAAAAYRRSLELDTPATDRCGSECAAVMERVAQEEGALFADADALFRERAGALPPGLEAFTDRVHWRPERNAVVSLAVSRALAEAGLAKAPPSLPPSPGPPPGKAGWQSTLRYAAWETQTGGSGFSLLSVAFFWRALDAWPQAAAKPRAALDEAAQDSNASGAAWDMPALERALGPFARHMALARLLEGDVAAARRLYAEAGAPQGWDDRAERAALRLRMGDRKGAARELETLWTEGAASPHLARDQSLRAAAEALLGAAPASWTREAAAATSADPGARWSAALAAGTLGAEVEKDPAAARAAARALAQGTTQAAGIGEELFSLLGDEAAARKAACRPGRGPAGHLACAKRLRKAGEKEPAARAAVAALSGDAATARAAALLLQDLGRVAQAAKALDALSSASPRDAGFACDAGTALFLAGEKAGAAAAFRRAKAADAASSCAASGLSLLKP